MHRCRIVARDLRSHGQTEAADEADFSAATPAADVVAIWHALFGDSSGSSSGGGHSGSSGGSSAGSDTKLEGPPPTTLCGHSMGGAVAVHAAALGGARGARACIEWALNRMPQDCTSWHSSPSADLPSLLAMLPPLCPIPPDTNLSHLQSCGRGCH